MALGNPYTPGKSEGTDLSCVIRLSGEKLHFPLAPRVGFWHNGYAEFFGRAEAFLRVPSRRVAWLANGAEEVFCNYL